MNAPKLAELIDQYLLGRISPEDKLMLEQLMATDPGVAEIINESRQAFRILLYERNRRLKEKLSDIDKNKAERSSLVSRLIISFSILLLIVLSSWYWCMACHHPSVIASQYFGKSYLKETRIMGDDTLEETWIRADSSFLEGDYALAIQLYNSWMHESKDPVAKEARWNILLATLALNGPTPTWKGEMTVFILDAPEPAKSQGQELVRRLDSSFCNKIKNFFFSLNPKII